MYSKESFIPLSPAPTTIEKHKEIAIKCHEHFEKYFNELNPEERVFIYYFYRASLPGNRIFTDQCHRDALAITEIFEEIVSNKDKLSGKMDCDVAAFIDQATTYLIYMWSNHCQYFLKEHADHKRTPESIGLPLITAKKLQHALTLLGHTDAHHTISHLSKSLFKKEFEPTLTVPDSINQSAVNIYSRDFTDHDFNALLPQEQTRLNAYFYVNDKDGKRSLMMQPYSIGGRYDAEFKVSVHWLQKALDHVKKYPESFDEPTAKSLEYLIGFLTTGDEELFKKHSIEWLKTNNRLDYTFGFIETYDDPKSYRGAFEAEVTIKTIDMKKINSMLPSIEARLPFPKEFMRDNLESGKASVPNASINIQAFGSGEMGPLQNLAAYCLPNYPDIRSHYGSKQIIYHSEKSLAQSINAPLYKKLFFLHEYREWVEKNDPEMELDRDIWMLQVILHETLGHGSGKLTTHTFVQGENLTIEGKTYKVGDTIPVTSSNVQQLLAGFEQTLEELRAEILALYTSVAHYDEFAKAGLLKEWPKKCSKEFMINQLILNMVATALRRLLVQQENATEIAGDHARANCTIMNFLIERGGITLDEEKVEADGETHTVLGLVIRDQQKVIQSIKDLAVLVQTIKSTGDFIKARDLINNYGKRIRKAEHIRILKNNYKKVVGDLKASSALYPNYIPVRDLTTGEVVDVTANWPASFVEQQLEFKRLMMSVE